MFFLKKQLQRFHQGRKLYIQALRQCIGRWKPLFIMGFVIYPLATTIPTSLYQNLSKKYSNLYFNASYKTNQKVEELGSSWGTLNVGRIASKLSGKGILALPKVCWRHLTTWMAIERHNKVCTLVI